MNFDRYDTRIRSTGRRALLALCFLLLASCRLVISTDDTGYIVSASGTLDCLDASCAISVDGALKETFTAVAAEGYRFVGWRGVCKRATTSTCTVKLFELPVEFRQFSGDVELSAVFESAESKRAWHRDSDADGYGAPNKSTMAFQQPEGFVVNKLDCDDDNDKVHPRAKELADGIDNNCDGQVDEGFAARRFYIDRDGDGFGDTAVSELQVEQPAGYVENDLDCNDYAAEDNPEAEEVLDERDNDCDGDVDEGGNHYYPDADGDGFGRQTGAIESLQPVEGYVDNNRDCDDNNNQIHPEAEETLDSVDNDCDGSIDEGFTPKEYYRDVDGDGFGDSEDSVVEVEIPPGYAAEEGDNCVDIYNPSQSDVDEDGIGDACDPFTDTDGDGTQDSLDNCPGTYNPGQGDEDGDGRGDACDEQNGLDVDSDGVYNEADNCPETYNPNQADTDGDTIGDACDEVDDRVNDAPGGETSGGDCQLTAEEQSMLAAVNAVRAQARVCGGYGAFPPAAPLAWNCKLKGAALNHSMDMANNNFFSHTGSDGNSVGYRVSSNGYAWSAVGENIAAGIPLSSVGAVVEAWVDSPGHCANLMRSSYTELGAAKFSNVTSNYSVYWTQVFGRPR